VTRTSVFAPLSTALRSSFRLSEGRGVNGAMAGGAVLLLAAACWAPHLPAALWLDETLTAWVIRDSFGETIDRTLNYQPQPGYYLFMWFWTRFFGVGEVALRLPSLLAAVGACFGLAHLGARLTGDRETGWLAAIVLASTWNVYRESVDARSYMLGLLVLIGLAICLVRWIDSGRWREAIAIGLLGAFLVNLHLFFALVFPALVVYAGLRWSSGRADLRQAGCIVGLLALGGLLFLPVGLKLLEHGGSYSFVPMPTWSSLFGIFVWTAPTAGLLAGLALAGILGGGGGTEEPQDEDDEVGDGVVTPRREVAILLMLWVFVPLFILYAVSTLAGLSVFLGRYLIPAIPAVAILYAMALRSIWAGPARIAAVLVLLLTSFVTNERPPDDFRGAARAVNEFVSGRNEVPVLFASGLIEGEDENWLRDPGLADYLNAPTDYYPIDGRLITLPRRLAGHSMTREIVEPVLDGRRRFAAVEWIGNGARTLGWLIPRAERAGYRVERRAFGGVRVAFFRPGA